MYEVKKLYFNDKRDAEDNLSIMKDIAHNYGVVTVSDYYDICSSCPTYGIDGKKYGWLEHSINQSVIVRDYALGWYIKLHNPVPLCQELREASHTSKNSIPEPLCITIHTKELDDPDATLAETFKYIYTIKDRMVNLTIM